MTNGEQLVARAAMKPLPTLTKPLRSVDIDTKQPAAALRERTDSCTVPAAGVVGEAMVAFVLADAYRAKFGGDHIDDVRAALSRVPREDRLARVIRLVRPSARKGSPAAPIQQGLREEGVGSATSTTEDAAVGDRRPSFESRVAGRVLVLVGFMGAGKSSALPDVLDTDRVMEDQLEMSIATFFAAYGEAKFRRREESVVLRALRSGAPVVALGGGSLGLGGGARGAARAHRRLADVSPETAWERAVGGDRPLASDREAFEALHAARHAIYEAAADAFLPEGDRGSSPRALPALRALAGAPAGTKLVVGATAGGEYPVYVGRGIAGSVLPGADGGRGFLVTDEHVGPLYAARMRGIEHAITIAAGEEHKTLAAAEQVWRELARAGMGHGDRVVALGGGVVGDLAGFCAATYQRGVPVVQVPTTVVAQVDSAYGGKTGVDLPEAKNYVGAYHQPAAVVTDVETLATLPAEELAAGYAEVVKTALIAGGAPVGARRRGRRARRRRDRAALRALRSSAVVAADERDGGMRQLLNLGHTVGHAIETVTGYRRYRHGEAVALGLLAALRLSDAGELRSQVARAARRARACRRAWRAPSPTTSSPRRAWTRSAAAARCRSSSSARPATCASASASRPTPCSRLWRSCHLRRRSTIGRMPPAIVPSRRSDRRTCARRVRAIYDEAFPARQRVPFEELVDAARSGEEIALVGLAGGRPMGFAFLSRLESAGHLFLEYFAIASDMRGGGRGGALWRRCATELARCEARRLPDRAGGRGPGGAGHRRGRGRPPRAPRALLGARRRARCWRSRAMSSRTSAATAREPMRLMWVPGRPDDDAAARRRAARADPRPLRGGLRARSRRRARAARADRVGVTWRPRRSSRSSRSSCRCRPRSSPTG